MKGIRRWLCMALCAALALAALPAGAEGATARALTLMVYVTGSDLESVYGAASADIQEMLAAGVDRSVTVLLMTGGSERWGMSFDERCCTISEIGARGMRALEQQEAMNMGEADTLALFLNRAVELRPAERYALILWDHGGGPMNGVCYDQLHGNDCLTLAELRDALSRSPFGPDRRLEWIGFDACLMASVETAAVCAPYAEYMIASEETEPGGGWNYGFLSGIGGDADGAATGRRIVDGYLDAYAATEGYRLTLACTRLDRIDAVERALDDLFGALDTSISAETFSGLSNHRRDCAGFGREAAGSDFDLVDLAHLAAQYGAEAPEAAEALARAVNGAVVYHRGTLPDVNGLAVYSPCYNDRFFAEIARERYGQLGFAGDYYRYICDYSRVWLGDALADYTGVAAEARPGAADGVQTLTLSLTGEQAAHYASAELFILSETFVSGTYVPVYNTQAVELGPDGTLTADYRYQALHFLDGDGMPLTEALQYEQIGDTLFIRGYLVPPGDDAFPGAPAWLMFREIGGALRYVGCVMLEAGQTFADALGNGDIPAPRQDVELDTGRWAQLRFLHLPMVPVYDDGGALLPFPQWPYSFDATAGFYSEDSVVDLSAPWSLAFVSQQFTGRNLYAQYVITDTQGHRTASPLLPIANNNVARHQDVGATLLERDGVRVALTGVDLVKARSKSGLYLRLDVENRTDALISLDDAELCLNGTALQGSFLTLMINPGNSQSAAIYIPTEAIPPLRGKRLENLSMQLAPRNDRSEPIGGGAVSVDLDVDLAALGIRDADEARARAECAWEGVTWQLLSLTPEDGGELSGLARLVNASGEAREVNLFRACIALNRCLVYDCAAYDVFTVPAGREAYVPLRFSLTSSPQREGLIGSERPLAPVQAAQYWGLGAIERLDLMLQDGTRLRFDLDAPVAMGEAASDDRPTVLRAGPLEARLRGVRRDAEALWIDLDIDSAGDAPMKLALDRAVLDGDTALGAGAASLVLESSGGWSADYFAEPVPDCRQRAALKLKTDARPSRLELQFCYGEQAEGAPERYTTAAVLALPHAMDGEGGILADDIAITPAEAAPNEPIDPVALFDPRIAVPDAPERYAVTLEGRLDPKRAARAERVEALLVRPIEGDLLTLYATLPCTLSPDGSFRADYNGLLLCLEAFDDPLAQVVDGNSFVARQFSLSGTHGSQPSQFVLFRRFCVELSGGEARLTEAQAREGTEIRGMERFNTLAYYHVDYPMSEGDGDWPHYSQWQRNQSITGGNTGALLEMPRFALKPAAGMGLFVTFAVTEKDGDGYTLPELKPYK